MASSRTHRRLSRRAVTLGLAAGGVALAAGRGAAAQTRAPVKLSFWTFENPQQRPWIHKRVKLFVEQNPAALEREGFFARRMGAATIGD